MWFLDKLYIILSDSLALQDRDYHGDIKTNSFCIPSTFDERSVLNTAILWMATSRKQVTNRLYIAVFVRKSILGLLLWNYTKHISVLLGQLYTLNGTGHFLDGTNHFLNGTSHFLNGTSHFLNGTNHLLNGTSHFYQVSSPGQVAELCFEWAMPWLKLINVSTLVL